MGGISIWQLLIIAAIVVLMFGTKKLRTLGSDLGASIKGFKKAMTDDDSEKHLSSPVKNDSTDADFNAEIEQQPTAKTEQQKSQNKEQV